MQNQNEDSNALKEKDKEINDNDLEEAIDENYSEEKSNRIENNEIVSAKTLLQSGTHNGNVFIGDTSKTERRGLPNTYTKIYIENADKYELDQQVNKCKNLIDSAELSVITCVDSTVIHILSNELFTIYNRLDYEIQQLLFNDYDRSKVSLLIDDLKKGHIKREKKLLLFIKNGSKYEISGDQPLLTDLEKKGMESVSQYSSLLRTCGCKLVYFAHSESTTKIEFSQIHISVLEPFLKFTGEMERLESIRGFQAEKKLPTNERELIDRLKILFAQGNFEEAVKMPKSNKVQFNEIIEKGEIYCFVLFIATFFRGFEFDEFENFLFLLINETEKPKNSDKLINEWRKHADKILKRAQLDSRSQGNLRIIYFNEESDAKLCKEVLIEERRFFLDRMAKFIASPECFYNQNFRNSTNHSINCFLTDFGQQFGNYYSYEVPFELLEVIEFKGKEVKNLGKNKDELSQTSKKLRVILNKLLNIREKETNYEFFKSIKNVRLNNPKLIHLANDLSIQKSLVGSEIQLQRDFNTERTIKDFRILRNEAIRLLDEANHEWIKNSNLYRSMIQRFSDLLVELERRKNGSDLVDIIFSDSILKYFRYSSILEVLIQVHFKSGKKVLKFYKQWFDIRDDNIKFDSFFGLLNLFEKDQTDFFKLFNEMSGVFQSTTDSKKSSEIEMEFHLVIFFNFYLETEKSKSMEEDSDNFSKSLFNTGFEEIKSNLDGLVSLLFTTDYETVYHNVFPNGYFFGQASSLELAIEIFSHWYQTLVLAGKQEILELLKEAIRVKLASPHQERFFTREYKKLRTKYNEQIINAHLSSDLKKLKSKRDNLTQFIKTIL